MPPSGTGVAGIHLVVDGLIETMAFFEGLSAEMSNYRPFFKQTQTSLRRFFLRQFSKEGDGPTGRWMRLTPEYAARKKFLAPGKKILVFSGALRRALVNHNDTHALRMVERNKFMYGTMGVDYASHHQYGTVNMPRRRIVDLDSEFNKDLEKNMVWHFRQAAIRQRRKTGGRVRIS